MNSGKKIFKELAEESLTRLNKSGFPKNCKIPGIEVKNDEVVIPLFHEPYRLSVNGVTDAYGEPANPAISVLVLNYVINFPEKIPLDGEWITFREFEGAGPLTSFFTENTNKIIETTFSGKMENLKNSAIKTGGCPVDDELSSDISMHFIALPGIPVFLRFNDKKEQFPAQCSILFRQSAQQLLDLNDLGIVGTILTGRLISGAINGNQKENS